MFRKIAVLLASTTIILTFSACGKATGNGPPTVSFPNFGTVPEINFLSNKPPQSILTKVLGEDDGKGQTVRDSDFVLVDYYGRAWGGAQLPNSIIAGSDRPRGFLLTDLPIKGWMALRGTKMGQWLMLITPPADAYGSLDSESIRVKKGDTLAYVANIRLAASPDADSQFQITLTNEALSQRVNVNALEDDDFGVDTSAAGECPAKQNATVYIQENGESVRPGQSVVMERINADWGKATAPEGWGNAKMYAIEVGSIKAEGLPLGSMILVVYPATSSGEPRAALLQILASYDTKRQGSRGWVLCESQRNS